MRVLMLAPLAILALTACAVPDQGPRQTARLPDVTSNFSAADPVRGAIISSSFVFARPSSVARQPAAAAEALGQLEFLAVELGAGFYSDLDPLAVPILRQGRAEAREAIGLRQDVAPQAAIDALFGTAAALRAGNQAAAAATLAQVTQPGAGPAALERLAMLPRLPQAAAGTNLAYRSVVLPRTRIDVARRVF